MNAFNCLHCIYKKLNNVAHYIFFCFKKQFFILTMSSIEKLNNVTVFNIEYTWKIVDFTKQFSDKNAGLKSSMFSSDDHDIQFQLELLTKIENNKKNLILFLYCFPGNKVYSSVPITGYLNLLDSKGFAKKRFGEKLFFVFKLLKKYFFRSFYNF